VSRGGCYARDPAANDEISASGRIVHSSAMRLRGSNHWAGPTERLVVAIHPRLLTNALDETAHQTDVELTERWDLIDEHIAALLHEMAADLDEGSPAGPVYGESLANALGVYLLKRYAVRTLTPVAYEGGLPGYRLERVSDYIAASLDGNISLAQLSAIADMSPHYFLELFKQSTGRTPHIYSLGLACTLPGGTVWGMSVSGSRSSATEFQVSCLGQASGGRPTGGDGGGWCPPGLQLRRYLRLSSFSKYHF
jgi:hypothetical protein